MDHITTVLTLGAAAAVTTFVYLNGLYPCSNSAAQPDPGLIHVLGPDLTKIVLQFAMFDVEARVALSGDPALERFYKEIQCDLTLEAGVMVKAPETTKLWSSFDVDGFYRRRKSMEGPPRYPGQWRMRYCRDDDSPEKWSRDTKGWPWYEKDSGSFLYCEAPPQILVLHHDRRGKTTSRLSFTGFRTPRQREPTGTGAQISFTELITRYNVMYKILCAPRRKEKDWDTKVWPVAAAPPVHHQSGDQ